MLAVAKGCQDLGQQSETGARAGDRRLEMGDGAADQRIILDGARERRGDQLQAGEAEVTRQRDQTAIVLCRRREACVELLQRPGTPGPCPKKLLIGMFRLGTGHGQRAREQSQRDRAQARRSIGGVHFGSHGCPS